jgi:uracil-DNA glycosylase family protein
MAQPTAAPFVPDSRDLRRLREAARSCRGCDLWERSTQTVFGEGPRRPGLFFVGEQPGDYEDRSGHPFVGPAGQVLKRGLEQAGIDPAGIYLTNAVKHFKWKPRGKRRIHQRPGTWEIVACRPWLLAELRALEPPMVVLLGAVAATSLLGRDFRVTRQRGQVVDGPSGIPAIATVHPSSILRAPPSETEQHMSAFVDDLRAVRMEVH